MLAFPIGFVSNVVGCFVYTVLTIIHFLQDLPGGVIKVSEILARLLGIRNGEAVHVRQVHPSAVSLRSVVLLPLNHSHHDELEGNLIILTPVPIDLLNIIASLQLRLN